MTHAISAILKPRFGPRERIISLDSTTPTKEKVEARVAEKAAEKEPEKVSRKLIYLLTTNLTLFCEQEEEKVVARATTKVGRTTTKVGRRPTTWATRTSTRTRIISPR